MTGVPTDPAKRKVWLAQLIKDLDRAMSYFAPEDRK